MLGKSAFKLKSFQYFVKWLQLLGELNPSHNGHFDLGSLDFRSDFISHCLVDIFFEIS